MEIIAVIISILSFLMSSVLAVFYVNAHKREKFLFLDQYSDQIYSWYKETLILLKQIEEKFTSKSTVDEHLTKLSAMIDLGRFYFPNIDKGDGFGDEKPAAYKGYRNLALDFLVAYYNLYKYRTDEVTNEKAIKLQRNFTSIIFEILRPTDRINQIKNLTDRYFAKNKIFEDFMKKDDSKSLEYIWKNYT